MRKVLPTMIVAMLMAIGTSAFARVTAVAARTTFVAETPGRCSMNSSDYDFLCPSGTCVCDTYSGTVSGALLGRGTINISITVDTGAATPGSGPGCTPFFGLVSLAAARDTETEEATGTICAPFANTQRSSVSGGFGIIGSAIGESGWGTLSGTLNRGASPALLTLQLRARIAP